MSTINYELESFSRQRILVNEEVLTGRLLMKLSGILFGTNAKKQGLGLYAYIRWIEDLVDSGTDPEKADELLKIEIAACNTLKTGSSLEQVVHPETELLISSLQSMESWQKDYVLSSIIEILTGITLDNNSIKEGIPLDHATMQERHLYESMSGFQIMAAVFWNREFLSEKNEFVERLFRTWILYDALCDLDEDLSAGLVLFTQDDLDQFGISLIPGDKIDSKFKDLFDFFKPIITRELISNARAIYESNIPRLYLTFLLIYFISRILKLKRKSYPVKNETTFGN